MKTDGAAAPLPRPQGLRAVAIRGLAWGVGAKGTLLASNMLVLMITSRLLTPAQFGVFAAALIVTDLAFALATSWIGVTMVQKADLSEEERSAGFFCCLGLGIVLALASAAASFPLARILGADDAQPVLCVLALFIPFKLLAGYYGAGLQRALDLRYYQISQALPQMLGGLLVTVGCAWSGWGVWALVAGSASATLIDWAMTMGRTREPVRWVASRAVYRGLFRRGTAPGINRMLAFAASNVDRAITGALLGPTALGLYVRAINLLMVPVKLIGLPVDRTFLPVFSKRQDDRPALARALQELTAVQVLIYLPVGLGLALCAPILVALVLGSQWTNLVPAAQVLFLALFARLGYIPIETASLAVGEARYALRRQAAYATAVALGAWLGSGWGVTGVAAGAGLAVVFFYGVSLVSAVLRFGCSAKAFAVSHLQAAGVMLACLAAAQVAGAWFAGEATGWAPAPLTPAVYWCLLLLVMGLAPAWAVGPAFADARRSALQAIRHKWAPAKELPPQPRQRETS